MAQWRERPSLTKVARAGAICNLGKILESQKLLLQVESFCRRTFYFVVHYILLYNLFLVPACRPFICQTRTAIWWR